MRLCRRVLPLPVRLILAFGFCLLLRPRLRLLHVMHDGLLAARSRSADCSMSDAAGIVLANFFRSKDFLHVLEDELRHSHE